MKKVILLVCVGLVVYFVLEKRSVDPGPGIVAPDSPLQEALLSAEAFRYDENVVYPLASFQLTARVLSRENYTLGKESDLSPVDLAFGWGPMSDSVVLDDISISQSGRWYRWRVKELPIPRREIEVNSANMHIIPSSLLVENELDRVRKGHVVALTGKLVRIKNDEGWEWSSSLTREDTGARACELIWVESLKIL